MTSPINIDHCDPSAESYKYIEAGLDVPPPYSTADAQHCHDKTQIQVSLITPVTQQSERPDAIALEELKSRSAVIDCPRCRYRARTDIETYDTGVTLFLRLVVFPLGCYDRVWRKTMNAAHFCGNCRALIAIYRPFAGGSHDQTPRNYGPAEGV